MDTSAIGGGGAMRWLRSIGEAVSRAGRLQAALLALVVVMIGAAPTAADAASAFPLRRANLAVGGQDRSYSFYVSTKVDPSGYNMVVYALHDSGQTAEQFAEQSGWARLAEENGFAVVFPEAGRQGWSTVSGDEDEFLKAVHAYASTHLTMAPGAPGAAPAGGAGRGAGPGGPGAAEGGNAAGRVPTWGPFAYLTGVGAGATVAQEFVINQPGVFAAVATLGGAPYNAAYAVADQTAQGYFQNQRGGKNAIPVWRQLKKEVPVAAWIFTAGAPTPAQTRLADYWKRASGVAAAPANISFGAYQAAVYRNPASASQQVRLTTLPAGARYDEALASTIWNDLFDNVARWTSSPNGDLGPLMTKAEVQKAFQVRTIAVDGRNYIYYLKLPSSHRQGQALPLVLSAHGGGFPAWIYLSQNKMHEVGEKEGFISVYLQGQQNRWGFADPNGPDQKYIPAVIADVVSAYGADRGRVYMDGFSIGSGTTFMMGLTHPQLFAAVAPNNGIGDLSPAVIGHIEAMKAKQDIRIPVMVVYGDVDGAASTDAKIPGEGVLRNAIDLAKRVNNIKTPDRFAMYDSPNTAAYSVMTPGGKLAPKAVDRRYPAGRFQVYEYMSADPQPLNLLNWVWVTDMPHGTDVRTAQLEWDFFKRWRRNPDGTLAYVAN